MAEREERERVHGSVDAVRPWAARATLLTLLGAAALLAGLLLYATDRDASRVALMPALGLSRVGPLFGSAGAWWPSFVHPFAFSLLTVALSPTPARSVYRSCVAWWLVNIAFELGQHPSVRVAIADALHRAAGDAWAARMLANYFVRGTFDVRDLVAATAGALAAAALLRVLCVERRHAS